MNEFNPVLVYQHKTTGEIKVRWIYNTRSLDIDKNWIHIASLDPRAYISFLLNEYPNLVRKLDVSRETSEE